MKNDWVLDVLTDLKSFAVNNGMVVLAAQLGDTKIIAKSELLAHSVNDTGVVARYAKTPGMCHRKDTANEIV